MALLLPLALCCLMIGFGVWGVMAAADAAADATRNDAYGIASDAATSFEVGAGGGRVPTGHGIAFHLMQVALPISSNCM